MIRRVAQGGVLVVTGALIAIGVWRLSFPGAGDRRSSAAPVVEVPELFGRPGGCPHGDFAARAAARAESQAILLSERYPYDARDGVRAVVRFQEAQSCYEASGATKDAGRAARRAATLAERIRVDYASSRLALETAIVAENWSVAYEELHKLLGLTAHLGEHPFADHLKRIAGRLTNRATAAR